MEDNEDDCCSESLFTLKSEVDNHLISEEEEEEEEPLFSPIHENSSEVQMNELDQHNSMKGTLIVKDNNKTEMIANGKNEMEEEDEDLLDPLFSPRLTDKEEDKEIMEEVESNEEELFSLKENSEYSNEMIIANVVNNEMMNNNNGEEGIINSIEEDSIDPLFSPIKNNEINYFEDDEDILFNEKKENNESLQEEEEEDPLFSKRND
ncbi:hypothetical protein ABK040_006818 [Willaertia magna]